MRTLPSRSFAARAALSAAILLLGGVAIANGIGGDSPPARIPIPARDFSASFEDKSGVTVQATRVTFNSEVFVYGTLGEAQVTVPFEKIDHLRFVAASEAEKVSATAVLKGGGEVSLVMPDDSPWYGEATFGNYQITVDKLKRVSFP